MIDYEDFTENQKQIIALAWKEAIETEMDEGIPDEDEYCQETYKVIDGYFDDFFIIKNQGEGEKNADKKN